MQNNKKLAILLFFFFTGIAGLIYQVVWQQKLVNLFGVSLYSVTIIIVTYMAGLGFGSALGGYISSRTKYHIRLYGVAEILVAIYGACSLPLIDWFGTTMGAAATVPLSPAVKLLYLLGSFCFFLIPTLLMGMTLPLLVSGLVKQDGLVQKEIGELYGVNTLGAAIGALAGGLFLIECYGTVGSICIAATLNLVAAFGVMTLFAKESTLQESGKRKTRLSKAFFILNIQYFLVGFLALGYEIFIFRYINNIVSNVYLAFPTMLFFYLMFIGFGSVFSRRIINAESMTRERIIYLINTYLMCFVNFLVLVYLVFNFFDINVYSFYKFVFGNENNNFIFTYPGLIKSFSMICLFVFPVFFFGALFPLFSQLVNFEISNPGQAVSSVYISNTIGSILGTALFGFFILPQLGSKFALSLMAITPTIMICFFIFQKYHINLLTKVFMGTTILLVILFNVSDLSIYPNDTSMNILATREDEFGVTTIVDKNGSLKLYANNSPLGGSFYDSATNEHDISKESFIHAFFITWLAPEAKSYFSLGLGDASMAMVYLYTPEHDTLKIVEINRSVVELSREYNESINNLIQGMGKDFFIMDAKKYLEIVPDRYDILNISPIANYASGSGMIFSKEFMELVKSRLTPKGIMYTHIADGNIAAMNAIMDTFEYVYLYCDNKIVASNSEIDFSSLDLESYYDKLHPNFKQYVSKNELKKYANTRLFYRDMIPFKPFFKGIPPSTLSHPLSEYVLVKKMFPSGSTFSYLGKGYRSKLDLYSYFQVLILNHQLGIKIPSRTF